MVAQPISFDFSQPAAQVLAVVFFVIPGLNVTWVTDRLEGRTSLSPSERLLRAVTWSVVVYAVMSPWLLRLQHEVADRRSIWPWEPILVAVVAVLAAPIVLGILLSRLRRAPFARRLVRQVTRIDPAPRAWDFAFRRQGPFFVRLKLRSGERMGGEFAEHSFASGYPESRDLFLERAWKLDEDGGFVAR